MDLRLSIALANNPRTWPIMTGEIKPDGIELIPTSVHGSEIFWRQLKFAEFDVSEMSLGELAYFASRGLNEYLAVPIFPYRMFRHGFVFKRTGGGIASPEDISGKRVALTRLVVTAGVWMRGMLTNDYGVAPVETEWHYASVHHWQGEGEPERA